MLRIVSPVFCLAVMVGAFACSDSQRRNSCSEVSDPCEEFGETRCNRENDGVEVCGVYLDGCFSWGEFARCGGPGSCLFEGGEASCDVDCVDECPEEEQSRCRGDAIEVCLLSDVGCLFWSVEEDCGLDELSCQEDEEGASCSNPCAETCPLGEQRCRASSVEQCELGDLVDCNVWEQVSDCSADGQYCEEDDGDAWCVDNCVNNCDVEGMTACDGTAIAVCVGAEDGCLQLVEQRDCADDGLLCEGAVGGAICACPTDCEHAASRCSGDVLQQCMPVTTTCWAWLDMVDCAALGLPCDDSVEPAECVTGSGDSCDDALALWDFPAVFAGADFGADFGDGQSFTDGTCEQRRASPEAIFVVDLEAGDRLWMMEWADVDIVFSVQSACDADGACDISFDDFDWDGLFFDPPTPGRYWIIVETSGPDTASASYEIEIDVLRDEDCGDGVDNDRDGETDCADDDCFGDPTWCSIETECSDGDDNDSDRLVDCDDPDCIGTPACGAYLGIWEQFEVDEWLDLSGTTLTFNPDATEPMGYAWTATSGLTVYPVTPGVGTTTILTLDDDDFEEIPLTVMGGFDFYGVTYDRLFVSSNGLVTFDDGVTSFTPSLAELFNQPTIAMLWSDLNPAAGGAPAAVTVDELADQVVVTWDGVVRFGASSPNDLQLVLRSDGTIEMHFVELSPPRGSRPTIVGITNGEGLEPYPLETDYVGFTPEADCGDGIDNDGDGAVDCDDPDCSDAVGCFEANCGDGLDDDGDGDIDCDDPDCFGDPTSCGLELNCEDGADNDGDGAVDCDDSDCDDPWICEPYHGIWEHFERGDLSDLEAHTLVFTPDAAAPEGYLWTVAPVSAVGFPVPPGTGVTPMELTLTDDDFQEVSLAHLSSFTFYGVDYSEIFVSSNGYVTFGEGSARMQSGPEAHFELPAVSGLRTDLDPSVAGTITVDEFLDQIVVTWQGVPRFRAPDPATEPNDLQIVLHTDGSIDITTLAVAVDSNIVGISNGVGNGTWPGETNFVP